MTQETSKGHLLLRMKRKGQQKMLGEASDVTQTKCWSQTPSALVNTSREESSANEVNYQGD